VWKVSNPYRGTSESSYGLTTTSHDALGRVSDVGSTKSIVYPDGSPTSTTYSGQCSTVIDPANVTRTLCNDALGRLTSVNEGGLYTTSYTYNALDDLTTVTQGSQTRTFGYDSLSRLTSATNPESGTTSYTYPTSNSSPCSGDPSSPCTRTDARGITTTYAYVDPLNRLTSKTYSDGTPTANFAYDESAVTLGSWTSPGLAYPKGRLTHTTTMSGSTLQTATVQDYDKMGRTQHYWQCTPLNCGSASIWQTYYHYDLAGDSDWWTHPAGFTITNTISPARRITQVASSLSDSTHPANLAQNIVYNAAGSITGLQNGCVGSGCTQLLETYAYNKRLQMAVAELGTSTTHSADSCRVYNYYVGVANASACSESASAWPQGSNNDGDVAGYFYQDSVNSGLNHKAAYSYDGVNRLISAAATGNSTYSQAFSYDAYGNLNCTPAGPGCVALTYNTATNRITSSGYAYDAAGNLLGDGTYTYQWDAEAHLTKVYNGVMAVVSANTYNALGQRVRDVTQTTTTDEAYGAGGSLLWRYTGNSNDPNQRAFVPFQGGILAEYYSGGTLFDHPDEIGSITTASDQTGNNFQERLYYPFGESWTGANLPNLGMHQTFGKLPDYDPETDQYNTLNRHYSPSGRWLSPDPGGEKVVKLDDPQTWNLYAYVRNNPTSLTDPLGLWGADCAKDLKHCQEEKPQAPTDRTITAAAQPAQGQKEQAKPPANSRQDIVLVRAGKPQRYTALVWEIDWKIEERKGNNVESPGSKYEKSVVTLSEQVEGEKDWKSGGSGRGGFTDWISIESRTITQRFSVDSQRVQVVLRRDDQGNLVATWDVKVNVTPSGPVYSPAP
jgi:RHS repeat-associated protein